MNNKNDEMLTCLLLHICIGKCFTKGTKVLVHIKVLKNSVCEIKLLEMMTIENHLQRQNVPYYLIQQNFSNVTINIFLCSNLLQPHVRSEEIPIVNRNPRIRLFGMNMMQGII
jgi:hypothetical protein